LERVSGDSVATLGASKEVTVFALVFCWTLSLGYLIGGYLIRLRLKKIGFTETSGVLDRSMEDSFFRVSYGSKMYFDSIGKLNITPTMASLERTMIFGTPMDHARMEKPTKARGTQ